ncbi:class I tRNA ligase family protein [Nocardia sp. 2]|uniref:Class I tRNA ligase family protein n=1 Tax=Nocardia acididurans TaxID=2802282 RepID=A0ABS1ME31_9NOCA|nr:class I tRNA ligase family protein [Nocardia acididurans]MBL1078315.1 class I tRNA ligase family protein [Nocardia acididurans]
MTIDQYRDIVFTPPPTPNGGLHIGHVAGPYLRADLHTKLLNLLGGRAQHSSHIDNYQTYVAKKAQEVGREVEEFRRSMIDQIDRDYACFGIGFDQRVDNTTPAYRAYLAACLDELFLDERAVARAEFVGSDENRSAVEAFVSGTCPVCFQHAFANVCENCGSPLDVTRMIHPVEEPSGAAVFTELPAGPAPTVLEITEQDLTWLRDRNRSIAIDNRFIDALTGRLGAHTVTLTMRGDYGYAVGPGRVVNPWIDIFFAHAYALARMLGLPADVTPDRVRDELSRHPELRVTYYFGVDNSYYYSVLFPVLARITGMTAMLPAALKANRFLKLNGRKVSSSRNNVIWAREIAGTHSATVLRGALSSACPEYSEADFRESMLTERSSWRSATGKSRDIFESPRTEIGKLFRANLIDLADPAEFSVGDLLNRLDKAMEFANSSRAGYRESEEIAQMVAYLCASLDI